MSFITHGIISLFVSFVSAIMAFITSIGAGGAGSLNPPEPTIDPNANVVFTVVDQYGAGRRCLYQEKDAVQTDVAKYTTPDGILALTVPPGFALTIMFLCDPSDIDNQSAEATIVAPETGRGETTVIIPNPHASNTPRWHTGSGRAAIAAA